MREVKRKMDFHLDEPQKKAAHTQTERLYKVSLTFCLHKSMTCYCNMKKRSHTGSGRSN